MQISMGNTIGLNTNPVIAFQRGTMISSVPPYADGGISHNLQSEDIMAQPIQGIAFIPVFRFLFRMICSQMQ